MIQLVYHGFHMGDRVEEYVDDFIKCDGCGRLVDPGDSFLLEEAGQWLCAHCLAEEESCACGD